MVYASYDAFTDDRHYLVLGACPICEGRGTVPAKQNDNNKETTNGKNVTELAYDLETGNQVHFQRIHKLGHDWIYVSASQKNGGARGSAPAPFNIVHAPDCPCVLEGIVLKIFNGGLPGRITKQDLNMLLSFEKEYDASFRGDEAEKWTEIVARMTGEMDVYRGMDTYIAVLTDRRIPVGAIVIEHYKTPNVLLVTYCFVVRAFRRSAKGYSRRLMADATDEVRRLAAIPDDGPRVFIESENPDLMSPEEKAKATFDPKRRLRWIKSMGGEKLQFHYIQRPLSMSQEPVVCLDLYSLGGRAGNDIIREFLKDFYRLHGRNISEDNQEQYQELLKKQLDQLQ